VALEEILGQGIFAVVSLVFVLFGGGMVYKAYGLYKRRKAIGETETTEVQSLEPGVTEVKGTAIVPDGGQILDVPFSETEGVVVQVKVQEYHTSSEGGGSWKTIHENTDTAPFLVDDGTGTVRVDPEGADLPMDTEKTTVGSGEKPPERIRRYLENEPDVDEAWKASLGPLDFGNRRRYTEAVVEPEEDVYVLGEAAEVDDEEWGQRSFKIDGGDPFIVSDQSETAVKQGSTLSAIILFVIGVIFGGMGLFALLFVLMFVFLGMA